MQSMIAIACECVYKQIGLLGSLRSHIYRSYGAGYLHNMNIEEGQYKLGSQCTHLFRLPWSTYYMLMSNYSPFTWDFSRYVRSTILETQLVSQHGHAAIVEITRGYLKLHRCMDWITSIGVMHVMWKYLSTRTMRIISPMSANIYIFKTCFIIWGNQTLSDINTS